MLSDIIHVLTECIEAIEIFGAHEAIEIFGA
jgi:hypothetical protein